MIPEHLEQDVLSRYRAGAPASELHKLLWPRGNPSVTPSMLSTILESMDSAQEALEEPPPAEDLPDDLGDLLGDLARARQMVLDAVEAPERGSDDEDDGGRKVIQACAACKAVSDNVKTVLAVDKHRRFLQRHRGWLRHWQRGMIRG